MKASLPFLRGIVARRILGLFILCALLPIGSLAVLSLREMSGNLREQTDQGMRHASKNVTMTILQGLFFLQGEMETSALSFIGPSRGSSEEQGKKKTLIRDRHVLGLTFFRERSEAVTLFGTPCPPPPWNDTSRKHLASGQAMIFVQRVAGAPSRVYMALETDRKMPEQGLLVGEIHPEYMREIIENATPAESRFTILDASGAFLYGDQQLPEQIARRILDELKGTSAGQTEWDGSGETLLLSYRTIFLQAAFHIENWAVVVSRSRAEAFAPVRTFTRMFLLIVLLTVLVVSLISAVQIRRTLVPLGKLQEGTRTISDGNFESRIEVESGDEFEKLASSFNSMTERLGKEFRSLTDTGRIVRSVLTGLEKEKIVRTVLTDLRTVIPCKTVGLCLTDHVEDGTAQVYTEDSGTGHPGHLRNAPAVITPEEWRKLRATDENLVVESEEAFHGLLFPLAGSEARRFVLLPLLHQDRLAGILVLGYGNGSKQAREDLLRARQIADQISVALANAGLLEDLAQLTWGAMTALARAVDAKSPWTAGHSERVAALSRIIGMEMGLAAKELDLLHRGGLLHDIGKIGVPGRILDKPGKLTREEFALIAEHPGKGVMILEPIPALRDVLPLVEQHHERFHGKGYPHQFSGEAISLGARILAVADVYDGLVADRPYRRAFHPSFVLTYIENNAGLSFDPAVVQAFRKTVLSGDAAYAFREGLPAEMEKRLAELI